MRAAGMAVRWEVQGMTLAGIKIVKPGTGDAPGDFRCKKPEFAEYLNAIATYDQQQRMGRAYWAVCENKVVGYIVLAMGSVDKGRQVDLGIDTYGPIPALLITRLATDERYERQGIGRYLIYHAVRLATKMARNVGCRIVYASSEPDVVKFYEAAGFTRFGDIQAPGLGAARLASSGRPDAVGEGEPEYVPMYIDLGVGELSMRKNGGPQGWQ